MVQSGQDKNTLDVKKILFQLQKHYNYEKKKDLAEHLGIKPSTFSTWLERNSMDRELVYLKCPGIRYEWLLTGDGEMFEARTVGEEGIAYLSDLQKRVMEQLSHDPVAMEMLENYLKLPRSQRYKYAAELLAQVEAAEAEGSE